MDDGCFMLGLSAVILNRQGFSHGHHGKKNRGASLSHHGDITDLSAQGITQHPCQEGIHG